MAKKSKAQTSTKLWNKRYKKFKQYYATQAEAIHKRDFQTYIEREGQQILTKTEFKEAYIALKNDRQKEIAGGKRKSLGNLEKAISSMQAYELSEEKAYAVLSFLKEYRESDDFSIEYSAQNINKLLMKIRVGEWIEEEVGLWDAIKKYRSDLFADHHTKAYVRAQVAITVFGSSEEKYKAVLEAEKR